MQRFSLILSAYDYSIEYRKSIDHALSRLPDASSKPGNEIHDFPINLISSADELHVMAKDISEATRKDPILSKVVECIQNGWPIKVTDDKYLPYYRRRNELSADQGCLLWGMRVVIPPRFRERMLNELHDEPHSIVWMKGLARFYLWWPGARCRHRGNHKRLHDMSVDAQYVARGTIASLGVARTCLAACSCRFC